MPISLLETDNSFLMICKAQLIPDDYESAWAEKHIVKNPNVSWAIGRYAEADRANFNKQYFAQAELEKSYNTIQYAPLNINHDPSRIMGFFAAVEMLFPTGAEEKATFGDLPYVEALAGVWRNYFPQDYERVKEASSRGLLSFSMEARPTSIKCMGEGGCGQEFAYKGPMDSSYCNCIQERKSDKSLINSTFMGGALVIPPAKPAWGDANIYSLVASEAAMTQSKEELVYVQAMLDKAIVLAAKPKPIVKTTPRITLTERAFMATGETPEMARSFNMAQRKAAAKSGAAMSDGSFPIQNTGDLKNAIRAIGRAPASKRDAVKAHIKSRAKSLGATSLIPDDWK